MKTPPKERHTDMPDDQMLWFVYKPAKPDIMGFLPDIFDARDPRPAKEQIADRYAHGGGWSPMEGWDFDKTTRILTYPGDEPMKPVGMSRMRDEVIMVYPHALVVIYRIKDGSFDVTRMD